MALIDYEATILEQAETFVGVESKHHTLPEPAEAFGSPVRVALVGADDVAELMQQTALGGLDSPTIEQNHSGAGLPCPRAKCCQQRRLSTSTDAVKLGDGRTVFLQAPQQLRELALAADHARGSLFSEEFSDPSWHGSTPSVGRNAPERAGPPTPTPHHWPVVLVERSRHR